MNAALLLAIVMSTLNFTNAMLHMVISRAPGWRSARAFALIALTAAFYSATNVVSDLPGFSVHTYLWAARLGYFFANLHVMSWYPFAWGGSEMRWDAIPTRRKRVVGAFAVIGVFFLITGLHMREVMAPVEVRWAHITYHYMQTTRLGDLYGLLIAVMLLDPCVRLWQRMLAGEKGLWLIAAGFVIFFMCAFIEMLVVNGVIVFVTPGDVGFLAVVVPTSVIVLRRFIDDANRLNTLTGRLEIEVHDRTAERDRAEAALLESERLAALGRLAAGVGHEINNPLTYLQLSLARVGEHLDATRAPEPVRDALADALDGSWRVQKVVEGLRTYSRRHEARRELDPREAVHAALKVAGPHLRHAADVKLVLEPTPYVLADEPRLVQALVNLLVNASQALSGREKGGRIDVRTCVMVDGSVAIEVADDGPGIPDTQRARLAEPYFTTRAQDGGLGLGLFVTRGIVDAHDGRLVFDVPPGGGTLARIELPALATSPPVASAASHSRVPVVTGGGPPPPEGGAPLLLIDDEPIVLRLLATVLESEWDVVSAADADEALRLLGTRSFERILCDLMLPGMSGMELADRIAAIDPDLRRRMVFLTGGAVTADAQAFLSREDVVHLMKPVDIVQLRAVLRAALPVVAEGTA